MTMRDTIQATFKGVPFNVEVETQNGGRKVAVHEYPGSDSRFVEDLGKIPGSFTINGFVSGDDWLQRDRRLTTKLDEETEGILELSVFGIRKVKAVTYAKTIRQTRVGEVKYTMSFLVSKNNPSPVVADSSTETVAIKANEVFSTVESVFSGAYQVPTTTNTVKVATYDGEQLTQTIGDTINSLAEKIDTVTSVVNTIRTNINDLVRDPVTYASELFGGEGLLGTIFDGIAATRQTLKALSDLCRAGYNLGVDFKSIEDELLTNAEKSFDIPQFADDTKYRITNNENRLLIVDSLRTSIFATYLHNASVNEYATDSEINITISDINDVYETVVLSDSIDPATALVIDQCRIEALKVLNTKLQTTPQVVDFNLKVPTVDVEVAYRLYAEEFASPDDMVNKAEILTDLNDALPTKYNNDIKVLRV